MTDRTTEHKLIGVIERASNAARLYGTAFIKITYDADKEEFSLNVISNEFVTVSYEKETGHD